MIITVKYKCACMQDEGSFEMSSRSHTEDIGDFMDRMGAVLARDHSKRNPLCRASKLDYVKLPANDGGVGT